MCGLGNGNDTGNSGVNGLNSVKGHSPQIRHFRHHFGAKRVDANEQY